EASGDQLRCLFMDPARTNDCSSKAPSLAANAATPGSLGFPAAKSPFGLGISGDGDMFITHEQAADSPPGSLLNLQSYVVRLNALNPPASVPNSAFISIGSVG